MFTRSKSLLTAVVVAGTPFFSAPAFATGETIEITGEVIDTWCYYSGVMGFSEAVRGTSHHTCALWCAAGGIPVGIRTEEGAVYMVLKIEDEEPLAQTDKVMELASDEIRAKGTHYKRDGVNYILVDKVVENKGITFRSHEDYDSVPPFAAPKKPKG